MNARPLPPFAPGFPVPAETWPLPEASDHPPAEKWDGSMLSAVSQPALGYYPAPANLANGTALIVCPGGGYTWLSMEHEGTTVAAWLNALGIAAFVLKSRLRDHGHPAPLRDLCAAIRRVRAAAPRLGLRTDRLGVIGFSAGGHLAAHACTWHADPAAIDADPSLATISARPDFAILLYPVTSLELPYTHFGTRTALVGPTPDPALTMRLSLHHRVNATTPPTCLVHAQDDGGVPVENSILYYLALRAAGVPAALHVYPRGGHGFGLGRASGPISHWPDRCAEWLRAEGWLG